MILMTHSLARDFAKYAKSQFHPSGSKCFPMQFDAQPARINPTPTIARNAARR